MEQAAALPPVAPRVGGTVLSWRDRTLAGLTLSVLLTAVFHGTGAGGHILQTVVVWSGLTVLHAVLFVYSRRVATHPDTPRSARRFWRAVTAASAIYFIGDLSQLATIAREPLARASATGAPFQALCVDVGTLLVVVVLLTSPIALSSGRERLRFWLDTATVMVGAAAFGWYFGVVPGSTFYDGRHQLAALHDLVFGPVVMLVGMFIVVKVLLSGERPFSRLAGMVLATAAGTEGAVQGLTSQFVDDNLYTVVFVLTIVSNGLLTASAVVQERQLTVDPQVLMPVRKRPYSLLPYGAIAATYALLVVVLHNSGLNLRAWLVLGAAIVSTALVVVRQLAAFTENNRLLTELDAKVRERDELAAALHHQAFHDSLTGLANRALFTDRLDADLARGRRTGTTTAAMLIDLDDFKPVNDRFGHRVGDDLLKEVAGRLVRCVRETDTIARLGGDEFAVLLEHPLADGVHVVAERIVEAIRQPVTISGERIEVGASVGVAIGHPGGSTADALLDAADVAMYRAKKQGRGSLETDPRARNERRHTPPTGLARLDAGPDRAAQAAPINGQPRRRRSDQLAAGAVLDDAS